MSHGASLPAGRQGGYGVVFGWYKGSGLYECRGTKLISETDLSKCNKCYKMGTGAVSRYKRTTKV